MSYTITQRMSVSGDDIDFAQLRESIQTDDFDHVIHTPKDGSMVIYKRNTQIEWELDVICTTAEADTKIRSWMAARSQVVFTPLLAAPSTTHNTRITNTTFPMRPISEGKWRGTINLRKE